MTTDWEKIIADVSNMAETHSQKHRDRLAFELKEINKQGANQYWIDLYDSGDKFEENKNGLVLPFFLGLTSIDPIKADIPHNIERQPDMPDIDIDLLPIARDPVKKYAANKYGHDHVCAVGSWLTYKPKLALKDAASALGQDMNEVMNLTSELPDEIDDMSCEESLLEFSKLKEYADEHPDVVRIAYELVGRIKAQGRHAGGLIISSVPVKEHIPSSYLGKEGEKQWVSTWTEGHSTQLSKFGFIKFDLLGLTTLGWIWQACRLIKKNRGVTIDWDDIDPDDNKAGWEIYSDGTRTKIEIDDETAMKMADELKTESIFQFETDLAKSILKNGVNTLHDLIIYTSLGRPGPLPLVSVYCRRRDGDEEWESEEHPEICKMLKDTFGVIVFQEQLSEMWHKIAGFTIPEAEAARKAVSKKWADKLEPVKNKWLSGASRVIGEAKALEWHEKMVTFGRYAFNRCLSKDTIIMDINHNKIKIEDLRPGIRLMSYNNGFIEDEVDYLIDCGEQDVFEIELDNHIKIEVTMDHKFLCDDNNFRTVREILRDDYELKIFR